jgi:hypothetical protein
MIWRTNKVVSRRKMHIFRLLVPMCHIMINIQIHDTKFSGKSQETILREREKGKSNQKNQKHENEKHKGEVNMQKPKRKSKLKNKKDGRIDPLFMYKRVSLKG